MIVNYTETFETLLQNQGYGEEEQSSSLTEILELMEKFPKFVFNEDIEFDMFTLFKDKYDIREIGAETEELFLHFWREKTQELLIKFVPKIKMWLDNFNDLFQFKVRLSLTDTSNQTTGNQNTYYLNPTTANTQNLKVQDVAKNDGNTNKSRTIDRDVLQSVWGKTRPIILKQIMELTDIYNVCIKEFEVLFMGVY